MFLCFLVQGVLGFVSCFPKFRFGDNPLSEEESLTDREVLPQASRRLATVTNKEKHSLQEYNDTLYDLHDMCRYFRTLENSHLPFKCMQQADTVMFGSMSVHTYGPP